MFYAPFPIIYTHDVNRLLSFYRDVLGFEEEVRDQSGDEPPRYIALKLGDCSIALSVPVPPPDGRSFELCVSTEDTDAAVARLRTLGVPVVTEPSDQPWGERNAYVADPDGHLVQIVSAT